ncbi:hypothetical protein HY642_02785 [Candidatus Woesearchaeota archaeon]|nr:hypothetical protein [Candidatus Woesearchaeota archaeon]
MDITYHNPELAARILSKLEEIPCPANSLAGKIRAKRPDTGLGRLAYDVRLRLLESAAVAEDPFSLALIKRRINGGYQVENSILGLGACISHEAIEQLGKGYIAFPLYDTNVVTQENIRSPDLLRPTERRLREFFLL